VKKLVKKYKKKIEIKIKKKKSEMMIV